LAPLPDFVFPLRKVLLDSLQEIQVLQSLVAPQDSLVEAEALVEVLEPWVQVKE
jgi:hypothetical protein